MPDLPPPSKPVGAEAWLGSPAARARRLCDAPDTTVIGSDAREVEVGPGAAILVTATTMQVAVPGGQARAERRRPARCS